MIERNEIDAMAESLGVHPSHVQRDYVHGWILSLLYSNSSLADRLILKGGNCLRKGYFEHSRYSRDVDFTTPVGISDEELGRELNGIADALDEKAGIVFDTSRTVVGDKKRADSEKKISEAKLYFRDFYGKESEIVLGVRLDVTQFDKIHLPIQERALIHPYSDRSACNAAIKCVKLEEILATKMRCLLQRKHIADLFDLVYAAVISPDIEIDRSQLLSTFFRITVFGANPSVAKGLFLDLPIEALGRFWSKYISCPNHSWFDFDHAKVTLFELIDGLIPGQPEHHFDQTFFPSKLRNPILEAADSQTLLRLIYGGIERLVEPYDLAFKVRRDGVAREYLYAYDTVGGTSSGPGLKTFVSENVQSIETTDIEFEPRFDIETNKSGSAESVSRFEGAGRAVSSNPFGARRARPRSRRPSKPASIGFGIEYKVECPYCGKQFKRKKMDTKLNKHKDKYGNPCYGKIGFLV
ncbi:MAG: nucleotidyl transferase AbiEii/AbiGii toxin family protein [Sedimenticola sp.]